VLSELLGMGRILGVAAWFGVVLASGAAHASPNPGGFWLSLSAEYRSATYQREWSGFLALNVPFDQIAAPRRISDAPGLAEEPPKKQSEATAPAPAAGTPPAADAAPRLTPSLARGAVRHALSVAGFLVARTRLGGLSSRARNSAALPELRLRTLHSSGQTLRLTPTPEDPYRYTQAGTSELTFEARLTWHLDRLVFAEQEVSIERLQIERDVAEHRLIDQVLARLALWQRSRVRAADVYLDPEARQTAELEALGAAVELDVLTGGWFSQAIGESDDPAAGAAGQPPRVEVNPPPHAR
jgi:hypothetical protein